VLIPSLYATSPRTQSLRPVRVLSDQNTRWRLPFHFPTNKRQYFLVSPYLPDRYHTHFLDFKSGIFAATPRTRDKGNFSECPIVEEESNADTAGFFDLLKDFDEPLWDGCTNHSKLSVIAQVFTIMSDHRLSEAGYDKIIEWVRSILPEGNRLKENFYAAKSMMKPLSLGYQKLTCALTSTCYTTLKMLS